MPYLAQSFSFRKEILFSSWKEKHELTGELIIHRNSFLSVQLTLLCVIGELHRTTQEEHSGVLDVTDINWILCRFVKERVSHGILENEGTLTSPCRGLPALLLLILGVSRYGVSFRDL